MIKFSIKHMQTMYWSARFSVRINKIYSEGLNVNASICQRPVLSSMLFMVAMDALLLKRERDCPWKF